MNDDAGNPTCVQEAVSCLNALTDTVSSQNFVSNVLYSVADPDPF